MLFSAGRNFALQKIRKKRQEEIENNKDDEIDVDDIKLGNHKLNKKLKKMIFMNINPWKEKLISSKKHIINFQYFFGL